MRPVSSSPIDAVGRRFEQRLEIARGASFALALAFERAQFAWCSASRERRSAISVAGAPSHAIGSAQGVDRDQFALRGDQRHRAARALLGERLRVAAAEHVAEPVGGAKLGKIAIAGKIQQRAIEIERLAAAQHHRADRQAVEQVAGVAVRRGAVGGSGAPACVAIDAVAARGSAASLSSPRNGSRAPSARAISRKASRSSLVSSTCLASSAARRVSSARKASRRARRAGSE